MRLHPLAGLRLLRKKRVDFVLRVLRLILLALQFGQVRVWGGRGSTMQGGAGVSEVLRTSSMLEHVDSWTRLTVISTVRTVGSSASGC